MSYLMACPFCGGNAVHRESHGWHGIGCETSKCPACLHALMFRTAEEAEATWNRRPLPAGKTANLPIPTNPQPLEQVPHPHSCGVLARYVRTPDADKRIARGDDFAGDAWLDTQTGETVYTVVGFDRNQQPTMIVQDGRAVSTGVKTVDGGRDGS